MKKLIQHYARDLTAGRLASGYEHSYRVYQFACRIGEQVAHDDEVLHAACFLHDVEMATLDAERSADKAEAILRETGFSPAKIPAVYQAIVHHMPGDRPETPEGRLLYDANLLDSLGAVGLARLAIGSLVWYHYKTMEQVLKLYRGQVALSDTFFFPVSRELAAEKIEFSRLAVEQLSKELIL